MKKKSPPVAKLATIIIVGLIAYKTFFSDSDDSVSNNSTSSPANNGPTQQSSQTQAVESTSATQDTTQETVNSITAQLTELQRQLEEIKSHQNTAEQAEQERFNEYKREMNTGLEQQRNDLADSLRNIQDEVNNLATNPPVTNPTESPYTVNTDPNHENQNSIQQADAVPFELDEDGFVIIEPVSVRSRKQLPVDATDGGFFDSVGELTSGGRLLGSDSDSTADANTKTTSDVIKGRLDTALETKFLPYITIPENTRLMDARARSTILGRLPRGGKIEDPYEFQVVVSGSNIAPGGHEVPGLDQVVMRGIAIGDSSLKCVRGNIFSMTFVFADGTITQKGGSSSDRNSNNSVPLATILDERATECVPGTEVGNEVVLASAQLASQSLQAFANAKAQAQTETNATSGGGSATNISGSETTYALSELLSGLGQSGSQLIANRYSSAFNAIMIPLDTPLIIEVKQQLDIDYDPNGRRISYDAFNHSTPNHFAN